jgi:DNA repair photolyase
MAIRAGVAAPSLAPLMARGTLRVHGGVEYRELRTRSLVNRCVSERVPFDWTVNPYRGCAMGCRYCYAAYTHEFMGIDPRRSFHSLVFVKRGGEAETARALARAARRGELLALGAATDPYQPAEAAERVTRRFLEQAVQLRGLRLGITTKGALVLRDLDLLRRIHERSRLSIHVSLVSARAELIRELEPLAPPPEVRIEVMRRLAEAGLEVGLSLAPILPGITDAEADLDALLAQVAAAGVRRASANLLFLRSPTREKYLAYLAQAFPRLLEAYQYAYAGRVYLRGRYRERTLALVERLRRKHGLTDGWAERESSPAPAQLSLWP